MNITILDRKTLGEDLDLAPLLQFGELSLYQTTEPEEVMERIEDAEIVITNKVVLTKAMMKEATHLKLICVAATGMNNVDLTSASELGIVVKNVTGYSTESVVQHTFTMAFNLMGRLAYYDRRVKSGTWSQDGLFTDLSQPFSEMAGKSWGIVGLGTIGKEVAKVAESFGSTVNYYSTSGKNKINDYHHCPLDELLSISDVVSIHSPLNAQTENLINGSNLSYLKEGAVLLNLGRGGIVNEEDLAKELNRREIYAGLDVATQEPISMENPLMHLEYPDRLLMTPHIAWASVEARQRLLKGIVENIKGFVAHQNILN